MKIGGRIEKLDFDRDEEGFREGFSLEGKKGMKKVF